MSEKLFDLQDRTFVLTGANGHLGKRITQVILSHGGRVLAISRSKSNLEEYEDLDNFHFISLDINDEPEVQKHIGNYCSRNNEKIFGLINNAYSSERTPGLDASIETIHATLQNCFVQYWTTTRSVLEFAHPRSFSCINVTSLWSFLSPNPAMYLDLRNEPSLALVSAKAAVAEFTRYMSWLYGPRGFRFNNLVPGMFPRKRGVERLDYMQQVCSRIALGRIGKPEDLDGAVLFLLSDASSYMTGQDLIIDGGFSVV